MDIRELEIWELAKRRVSFRYHFRVYLMMIPIFWLIWYLTGGHVDQGVSQIPWPIYPIFGWGIGILSHYLSAYRNLGSKGISKEFRKLLKDFH